MACYGVLLVLNLRIGRVMHSRGLVTQVPQGFKHKPSLGSTPYSLDWVVKLLLVC